MTRQAEHICDRVVLGKIPYAEWRDRLGSAAPHRFWPDIFPADGKVRIQRLDGFVVVSRCQHPECRGGLEPAAEARQQGEIT